MRKTIAFMKGALALIAILALLPGAVALCEAETPEATEEPSGEVQPASGYVLVSTATGSGWLPLPTEGEYSFPLDQVLPDGTEATNVIHLTPEGVYMEDSTCANHDCVEQGMVTLENRLERILGNMIICLPNQVTLELYTPGEVLEIFREAAAGEGIGQ